MISSTEKAAGKCSLESIQGYVDSLWDPARNERKPVFVVFIYEKC